MRQRTSILGCLIGLSILGGSYLSAQDATGSLRVSVRSEDDRPIHGAVVEAFSAEHLGPRQGVTNEEGIVAFAGLTPASSYVVTTELGGLRASREAVRVNAGALTSVRLRLLLRPVEEEIEATATADAAVVFEVAAFDFSSALTGQDLSLVLTEALPSERSYQSYLQLVPGVFPATVDEGDVNPAARSGTNFREAGGGVLGASRDNLYYVEGLDITDPVRGGFGADLNTEIIQEQQVLTGGFPAVVRGAPGLVTNVVTKSGGNRFSGSLNTYVQNDGLVEDQRDRDEASFSTRDSALTFGGPIRRDRLWFFSSWRQFRRDEDVASVVDGSFLRQVRDESDQGFLKLSWALGESHQLSIVGLNDPTDVDGSFDGAVLNNRDQTTRSGGGRFLARYGHVGERTVLSLAAGRHEGDFSRLASDKAVRNDVLFRLGDSFAVADEQLGGFGRDDVNEHRNDSLNGSLERSWGAHQLRLGVDVEQRSNFRERTIPGGFFYTSLDARYVGQEISAGDLATGRFTSLVFDIERANDYRGLLAGIAASPNRDAIFAVLDGNRDGQLSRQEIANNLIFDSTAGNPDGRINYSRVRQSPNGPQETRGDGLAFYLQDTWRRDRLTVDVGLRAERYEHSAPDGSEIFTFDWDLAPRLSLIVDLTGSGRHKLSAHYGRYYDPARLNLTNQASALTEAFDEQQVFVAGEWITYNARGGASDASALFAPATETPYTDDVQLGYQVDLGAGQSLEATWTRRQTRNLLETFDLALYAFAPDGTTTYPGPLDDPDSLWLGPAWFGFDGVPDTSVAIANLPGGYRDFDIAELVFRKRFTGRWQALASYTWTDARGNTTSDSSADLQGEFLYLDPRAPDRDGSLPGLIRHLAKAAASYHWPNGWQVGATWRFSSGTLSSLSESRSRRLVPIRVAGQDRYTYAGIRDRWLDPDAVGGFENDSWHQIDVRTRYVHRFGPLQAEFFVDIFNLFDDQTAIRRQDAVAGADGVDFGDALELNAPRRYFLGVRLGF